MATNVSKTAEPGIRTFLAVDLPHEARVRLAELERELEPHRRVLKLVALESLHITVKFLGSISASRLTEVEMAARDSAARCAAFSLQFSGVGTFPGGRRAPRVVWVGLAEDAGYTAFRRLFLETEVALAVRGFPRESREFTPHLTLARVREGQRVEDCHRVAQTVERLNRSLNLRLSFPVSHLTVFRSELSPLGPRYTPLAQAPLANS